MTACRFVVTTATGPGAIAIIQIIGDVVPTLAAVTGLPEWSLGRPRLVRFGPVDEGLAVLVRRDVAQVMPHGGVRVVQRMTRLLREAGAIEDPAAPAAIYPEARNDVEARMLATLARAASPLAVDLLLDQPRRWTPPLSAAREDDVMRWRRLAHLLDPPNVVVAGPPNVGKSTLANALLGRSMSITLDEPGTTRDYTSGRVDLAGLVVSWHDTPGLRESSDPIELRAIAAAQRLMERADLLVAVTDAASDWPDLPRPADLRIAARSDLGRRNDADLSICVHRGAGLEDLATAVRERLVPAADLAHPGRWRFDDHLDPVVR